MDISIDIILCMIISFVLGVIVAIKFVDKQEHLVNVDDSRRLELSKCCADGKCYSKPPHLRENCIENKQIASKQIDSQFTEMYTQEQYYKLLDELKIVKEQNAKMAADLSSNRINTVEPLFHQITTDSRDEVNGYDTNEFAPYIVNNNI